MDNADDVQRWIGQKQYNLTKGVERLHYRIGTLVKDTAVRYAPKSPTQAEKDRRGGATKRQLAAAKKRRTTRATSRPKPGGLMRSIQFKASPAAAEVFVAANSEAGKYAVRIHDEKGKTWFKRGPGTEAKGSKADDKFIARAITDNQSNIDKLARVTVQNVTGKD